MLDIEKLVGKAIHVTTEEQAKHLLSELDKLGVVWGGSGEKLTDYTLFDAYDYTLCFRIKSARSLMYGSYCTYKTLGYEILEFPDIFESEEKKMGVVTPVARIGEDEITVEQLKVMLSNFADDAVIRVNALDGYYVEDANTVLKIAQVTFDDGHKEVQMMF